MTITREMTSGRPLPQILRFSLPLLLGNMLQQFYALIDAVIVGKYLGINSLASVGASASVIFLILGFCNGCCCGFGIPVAQKFGARDYSSMRRMVNIGLQLSLIISVSLAILTSLLCGKILEMMQTPGEIFHNAYLYLLITFIGIPATFLYNVLSSIIRALGDSRTPFYFLFFSAVLNILLDLLCILGLGWGVAGAAIATVVSQGVSALLCFFYMYRKFDVLKNQPGEKQFRRKEAGILLGIGVPMGLQFSITAIGSIMLQSANNTLGTSCVAALTAALRIQYLMMCPFESLGIAMATYCGQNYGAGKPDRILSGVKAAGKMMLAYAAFSMTLLWIFADSFTLLFVSRTDTDIIAKAALYLRTGCSFFPFLGLLCILRYSIQGVGFTYLAMLSGVAEMIARGLVSLVLVPLFGYTGVCFGDPTAWVFADIFLIWAFLTVYKKLKRMRFGTAHE